MEKVAGFGMRLKEQVAKVVIGKEEVLDGIIVALLTGGHILLEGPPGTAKTLTVKAVARSLSATYKRVQFTPDLMPLDITGTNIFDFQRQQFVFKPGPVFTDTLLADEINRTPPKTQAALLEAMEERHVTIDGEIHGLSPVFTVFATQNPIEYEGTYPLPEAQLDRFFFKLLIAYPEDQTEVEVYRRYQNAPVCEDDLAKIEPVAAIEEILQMRKIVETVNIREEIIGYVHQIIKATREHPLLILGASPRAGIYLLLAGKALAAVNGREYAIPDDIQEMAYPVLRHRLLLKPEAQIDGKNADLIIKNILDSLCVPR
ncbi:MAG: AAA family ATPase [Bacillota bacterium]